MQEPVTPPIAQSPFSRAAQEPTANQSAPRVSDAQPAEPNKIDLASGTDSGAATKPPRKAAGTRAARTVKPLQDEPIAKLRRHRDQVMKHLADAASLTKELEQHGSALLQERPAPDAVDRVGKGLKALALAASRASKLLPSVTEITRRVEMNEIDLVQRQVADLVRTKPEILSDLKALLASHKA